MTVCPKKPSHSLCKCRAMPGRELELEVALARRLRAHALLAELRAKRHLGSS